MFSFGRGAWHCRPSRAAMVSPTASQLRRQSHAFRAVPFGAFGGVPSGITLPTRLFVMAAANTHSRAPSFMPPFPRNLGHEDGLWLAKSRLAS